MIASELGSGHYDDATRTWDWGWEQAQWRGTPRLRLDLHVTYADGTEQVVASDGSWKVSVDGPTPLRQPLPGRDLRRAARDRRAGTSPASTTARWAAARVVSGPAGVAARAGARADPGRGHAARRARASEPVARRRSSTTSARTSPAGRRFECAPPPARAVEVFYSEKLDDDGRASTVGQRPRLRPVADGLLRGPGDGDERWAPALQLQGFPVRPAQRPRRRAAARGRLGRRSSASNRSARTWPRTVASSRASETLNRIHRNTAWAIQSNLHGVITDTPVYEKNAWTGDAAAHRRHRLPALRHGAALPEDVPGHARRADREGEVPLLAPEQPELRLRGQAGVQARRLLRRHAGLGRLLVRRALGELPAPRRPARARAAYPAMQKYLDDWIPRWTDKDGDAYAHTLTVGPRRLGASRGRADASTRSRPPPTTRTSRASPADAARALGKTRGRRALRRALREHPRRLQRAVPLARTASTARRTRTRSCRPRRSCPWPSASCPRDSARPLAARLVDDITKARRRPRVRGRPGRALRAARAHRGRPPRRRLRGGHADRRAELGLLDRRGRLHGARRTLAGHDPLAQPPLLRRDRAVALRRPCGHPAARAGLREDRVPPRDPRAGLDRVAASYESVRGTVATSWRRTPTGLELDVTVPPGASLGACTCRLPARRASPRAWGHADRCGTRALCQAGGRSGRTRDLRGGIGLGTTSRSRADSSLRVTMAA